MGLKVRERQMNTAAAQLVHLELRISMSQPILH